jgi:hypothetical protein
MAETRFGTLRTTVLWAQRVWADELEMEFEMERAT